MRKVKLLTPRVTGAGQVQDIGDVIEVEPGEAAALVARGSAVAVQETDSPAAHAAKRKG